MFRRDAKLRLATAILLLAVIPSSVLAAPGNPDGGCARERAGQAVDHCAGSSSGCCCANSGAGTCTCVRQDQRPAVPPARHSDNGPPDKWAADMQPSVGTAAPGVLGGSAWLNHPVGFSPLGPSTQARLCVWRF